MNPTPPSPDRVPDGDATLSAGQPPRPDAAERAASASPNPAPVLELGERVGDGVGPYKLVSRLGEGGFGTVWLAERRQPFVQMPGPDATFWNERFARGDTPWDRGAPGPQLLAWLDAGVPAPCRIAVPGCGSGHDVAELARRGFDVTAIDCAAEACERTRARLRGDGLCAEVVQADVTQWRPAVPFDAVYEQTCLCAMHPAHWRRYELALAEWIRPGGTLFAMVAQRPRPEAVDAGIIEGPPYHCDINAMRMLFDDARWRWPEPPYPVARHPNGMHELGLTIRRLG